MINLLEAVRSQCADVQPALLERHFRRLTPTYFERYSVADIARHLRLLARLHGRAAVEVEIRPLVPRTYEVLVVGEDHPGTVACITAALAADGFDLQDLQVASYLDAVGDAVRCFVIVLWISGSFGRHSSAEVAASLRARLHAAFGHLAEGRFLEAQAAAADKLLPPALQTTPQRTAPTASDCQGMTVGGDFCLERRLAIGGMSEVWLATQQSLNRTVAVKLVRHDGTGDDDLLGRFTREGMVLGQFTCPHIVQVLAAGTVPGPAGTLAWMAMEHMAGGDLANWLVRHRLPPVEVATRWLRQALEGLHYAHRRGILHRDLKPHNLLLNAEGNLKVSDFGLLKEVAQPAVGRTPRSAILGTPHYMSPEQALGEALDERSDIFALGSTFFHVFSGRMPFQKSTPHAVLLQITQEEAPRLTEAAPGAPRPLTVLLARMMARRPDERYQDVGVILEDLASYERRLLLRSVESGPLPALAVEQWVLSEAETMAYQPPDGADDVVI